jgi:hypothetical protein
MMVPRHCYECGNEYLVDIKPWSRREDRQHRGCPARMPVWLRVLWALAVIAALLLAMWIADMREAKSAEKNSRCPPVATMPKPGTCSFTDAGYPTCAPGEIDPKIAELDEPLQLKLLCAKGGTQDGRCKLSPARRKDLFDAYSLPWPPPPPDPDGEASYEVDHRIEESLGGAQSWRNLWPQMALPKPGYHEKDRLETWLHRQACSGKMTLAEARSILLDWRENLWRLKAVP